MKQRPILFNGDMVRALLDGRKTQTRRIVKPAKDRNGSGCQLVACEIAGEVNGGDYSLCPYGRPGDQLWVREAHALLPRTAYRASVGTGTIAQVEHPTDGYTAAVFREGFDRSGAPNWRPSIHMPRWASRITLQIVSVRVERLQEISEADAKAEGMELTGWRPTYSAPDSGGECFTPADNFAALWESINGAGSWEANPWVWVVEFKRIEQ